MDSVCLALDMAEAEEPPIVSPMPTMVIASSQAMPTYPAMSSGTPSAFNPAAIPALMLTLPSVAMLTALLMAIVSITAPPAMSRGFPVAA